MSNNVKGVSSNTIVGIAAAVEVLGDTLMADDVGHVLLGSVNREKGLERLLVEDTVVGMLSRAVGSKTSSEGVRASANEPAASRAEPSVGVGSNGLVPAVLVVLVQNINAVVGVLGVLLQVIELHEVGHVHVVVVTNGVVEITSSRAAVDLEQGVSTTEATRSSEESKEVVVHVLGPATLRDSDEVTAENNTQSGEERGHVGRHSPDLTNSGDILRKCSNTLIED